MGEDKTKCILFKKEKKTVPRLKHHEKWKKKIKQYSVVEYLGCLLNENMSEESMAKRVLKKLMQKQNFFIGKRGTYHTLLKECSAILWYNRFWFWMLCLVSKPVYVTEK